MRTRTILLAGLTAAALGAAGTAVAQSVGATADQPEATSADWRGHGGPHGGYHHRDRDGRGERGGRGHGGWGHGGHHGGMGGFGGPMGHMMGGQMLSDLFDEVDADKDGKVTQAEVDAFATSKRRQFDANGDGMTLDEFQGLFLERTRTPMVRAFQFLDRDGDGKVSEAEFDRPVDRLVERLDRDGDDALSRTDRGRRGRGGPDAGPGPDGADSVPPSPRTPDAAPPSPPANPQ